MEWHVHTSWPKATRQLVMLYNRVAAAPVGIAAMMLARWRSSAAHSGPSRVPSRSSAPISASSEPASPISLQRKKELPMMADT